MFVCQTNGHATEGSGTGSSGTGSSDRGTIFSPRSPAISQRIMLQILMVWGTLVCTAFVLGSVGVLSAWTLNVCMVAIWVAAGTRLTNWSESVLENSVQRGISQIAWNHRCLALFGSIGIAQVVQMAILTLPHDWDTLAYHLPLVDSWIQTGSVWNQRCAFWYVPGNSELLAYWFCSPFSGDYWGQLNNVLVVILLVTALIEILKCLHIAMLCQMAAVTGVLACTPVLRQVASAENDIGVAALFLSSIFFAMQLPGCATAGSISKLHLNVLMLALSLGLMAGVKYYALGYVAIIAFMVMVVLWRQFPFRLSLQMNLILGLGLLILGAPWYVRNWIVTGSPLYPKGFRLLGIPDAWESIRPDLAQTTLLLGSTVETTRMLFWSWVAQGGLFLLFAVVMVVPLSIASVVSMICTGKHRTWSEWSLGTTQPRAILVVACIGALGVYIVTPNVIETVTGTRNMMKLQYHPVRFGFAFACVAAIMLALWLQQVFKWARVKSNALFRTAEISTMLLALGGLAWILLPQYGWRNQIHPAIAHVWLHPSLDIPAMDWFLLTVTCFIMLVLLREVWLWNRRFGVPVVVAIIFCGTTPWLAGHWHKSFDGHFQTLLKDNVSKELDTVAKASDPICVCEYRYYGMIGSYRQPSITRPLFTRERDEFVSMLEHGKFEFVIVLKSDEHWLREYENCLEWLRGSPDRFEQIAETGDKVLFRRIRDVRMHKDDRS